MALNPHVVGKAQEELDRVLGGERLPDFSDQEDLPYICAIVKELFRWGCPFPIGVPKRVMEDDTYNGYFIPAGATIVENIWFVNHQNVWISPYHPFLIGACVGKCSAMSPSTPCLKPSTQNGSSTMGNSIPPSGIQKREYSGRGEGVDSTTTIFWLPDSIPAVLIYFVW